MDFLFVDKIIMLQPGNKTLGIKHVTPNDEYLCREPGQHSKLLSSIIAEAIGQLCSWNVMMSSHFEFLVLGGIVGSINIVDNVYVGETIVLESTIELLDFENEVVNFHGIAKVGKRTILEIKNVLGPLFPLDNLVNISDMKKLFHQIYQPESMPEIGENGSHVLIDSPNFKQNFPFLKIDAILKSDIENELIAIKNIPFDASCFSTHFPKKPIFPLSLLIQVKIQLAYLFLAKFIDESKEIVKSIHLSRIKISHFVKPGDEIVMKIVLLKREMNYFMVNIRSEIAGKRTCITDAKFEVGPL